MAESSTITREMIEAGARALYLKDRGVPDDAWGRDLPESTMELWRGYARAALTASAAVMFGAKRRPYYTHACAGVEGMSLTLHLRDGSLELVFKDEELDLINEEGRDLYVAHIEASEVIHLRQWLIDFLPASEAEISAGHGMAPPVSVTIPADGSEERLFWLEAAEQHGFGWNRHDDVKGNVYEADDAAILKLMSESRKQGQRDALGAPVAQNTTQAEHDVLAERRRQVEAEGWTPEHDDAHDDGSLALAGAAYAVHAANQHAQIDIRVGVQGVWLNGGWCGLARLV